MKVIQEDVKAKKIPFKKDKVIVREVIQSTNRGHETGVGRLLPGMSSGSSSSQQASGYCTQEEADRLRKENEELGKAVLSQQLEIQRIVNHLNARQTGTSSQYPVPNLYTPQSFSSPNYTTLEHGGTSQIVRDADLDVDGDDAGDGDDGGSLNGDGGGSLDGDSGDESNDDSNDACDED